MQKGFVIIPILIGILVLGGVVGAWYTKLIQIPNFPPPGCYYKQVQCIQAPCNPVLVCGNPSLDQVVVQTPHATPFPSSTGDETANWKTYNNTNLGFSIKYPSDWNARETFVPQQEELIIVDFESNDRDFFNSKAVDMFLNAHKNPVNKARLMSLGVKGDGVEIAYGDIKGTLYETPQSGIAGSQARLDYLFNQKGIYYWVMLTTNSKNLDLYKPAFSKILSTFKFTDQNQSDETANWKTYAGQVSASISDLQKAGLSTPPTFSIKYPVDWISQTTSDNVGFLGFTENGKQYKARLNQGGMGLTSDPNLVREDSELVVDKYTGTKSIFKDKDGIFLISADIGNQFFRTNFVFDIPPTNQEKYIRIFNLMLSTFKFLN